MGIKTPNRVTEFFMNISIFRYIYVICLFLNSLLFFTPIGAIVIALLMVWSAFIIYFYYIKNKRIYKILYGKWLYLFLASCLFTALIHIQDNFFLNLYYVYQTIVCIFIFYGLHTENNKKRIKKEMYYIFSTIVFITTVLAVISIPVVFFTNGFDIEMLTFNENGFTFINQHFLIYENRFTGFYTNPNLLAFSSAVAIVCTHILSKKNFINSANKKPINKWLLTISAVFNFTCLFLSDSNSSLVFMVCYALGIIIFKLFGGGIEFTIKKLAIKVGAVLLALAILLPCTIAMRSICKTAVSAIISVNPVSVEDKPSIPSVGDDIVSFTHENKNLDSGRLTLLTESAAIIGQYPIFGVGKANLVTYGEKFIDGGLKFSDFHNGYLTILVCSGIVGFILFIGFAVHILRHSVLSLFLEKKSLKHSAFPCIFSFAFAYALFSVFEKTILNDQTFMVVIFWLFLGYLSRYMVKYNHVTEKFKFTSSSYNESNSLKNYDIPTEEQ